MPEPLPPIGFIGVGAMGGPMVRNLIRAGYTVHVYDIRREATAACGGEPAPDIPELVRRSEFVLTSLPSSDAFVRVADEELLPHLAAGQIVIDLGTTTPPEA